MSDIPKAGHADLLDLMRTVGELIAIAEHPSVPCPLRYQAAREVRQARELLKRLTPETVPSD
jgi:hypothetical protein